MAFSRRDFLKGSTAVLGLAMLPFRVRAAKADKPVSSDVVYTPRFTKDVDELRAWNVDKEEEVKLFRNVYCISSDVQCYAGISRPGSTKSYGKVSASGVEIVITERVLAGQQATGRMTYCRDACRTEIRINRLHGVMSDVEDFFELSNLEHECQLILAVAFRDKPGTLTPRSSIRDTFTFFEMFDKEPQFGMRFTRPVITSVRLRGNTPGTRIDAYGINAGKDIEIPMDARMGTLSGIEMFSGGCPTWIARQELDEFFVCRVGRPSSFDYNKLQAEYMARRSRQTPAENLAEDQAVIEYAGKNFDASAWERASDQLKGFNPEDYRRRKPGRLL